MGCLLISPLALTLLVITVVGGQLTAADAQAATTLPPTTVKQPANGVGSSSAAVIAALALISGGLIGAGATVGSAWLANKAAERTARLTSAATKDTAQATLLAAGQAAAAQRDTVVAQIGADAEAEGIRRRQATVDRRYARYDATIAGLRDAIGVLSEKFFTLANAPSHSPQLAVEAEYARQTVIKLMQWLPRDDTPASKLKVLRTPASRMNAREQAWSFVNYLVDENCALLLQASKMNHDIAEEVERFNSGVRSTLDRLAVLQETLDREQEEALR